MKYSVFHPGGRVRFVAPCAIRILTLTSVFSWHSTPPRRDSR